MFVKLILSFVAAVMKIRRKEWRVSDLFFTFFIEIEFVFMEEMFMLCFSFIILFAAFFIDSFVSNLPPGRLKLFLKGRLFLLWRKQLDLFPM
ncbi:hypothetical protein CMI46_01825 [Candidatus Pacearchaeota archaeon]|nr:hypothetical protein [Candidatus Pacearchaeota archaeon]